MLAAGSRRQLRVYDLDHRAVVAELDSLIPIRSFRLSADGHRLITIPTIRALASPVLWDMENYRVIARLEGQIGQVFSARFVRRDREILTAGADGVARLWDGTTGRLRQTYFGSSIFVLDAVLDPEGSTVVTAGGDGVLRFWDAFSGRMLWALRAHKSSISGVHFQGPDIVTRALTGEVARWTLSTVPSLQGLVHKVAGVVDCFRLRFDEDTGGLVEQPQSCAPNSSQN